MLLVYRDWSRLAARRDAPRPMPRPAGRRLNDPMLDLSAVTLCCVDTAEPRAGAARAGNASRREIRFARSVLVTDALPAGLPSPAGIDVARIEPLASRDAYSPLRAQGTGARLATPHVLLVQWDGYVVNPQAWETAFLDCDYLGAKWFWFTTTACAWATAASRCARAACSTRCRIRASSSSRPRTRRSAASTAPARARVRHPLRHEAAADRFSFEVAYPVGRPFGFHGLFNFCRVMPSDEIATLAPAFSDAIARSPQIASLLRNCVALGQWARPLRSPSACWPSSPGTRRHGRQLARSEAALAQGAGIGRNDPCPCGSGRRYKQCHGATGALDATAASPDALVARAMAAHQRGELDVAERKYRAALDRRARAPARAALSRRHRVAARAARGRAAAARAGDGAGAAGAGVPQQPGPRARRPRPAHGGGERAPARAGARSRARRRVEQPRARAAGREPARRGGGRLPPRARAGARLHARPLEPRARPPLRGKGSRGVALLRGAPRGRVVRRPRPAARDAALGRQRPARQDDAADLGAGPRRRDPVRALRPAARGARRPRDPADCAPAAAAVPRRDRRGGGG